MVNLLRFGVIGIISVLCCILMGTPAIFAQSEVDLLQQQRQQVQQQRQQVEQQRDQLKKLETTAEKERSGLQKWLKSTETTLQSQEVELDKSTKALRSLEQSLTETEASYRQQQLVMLARLQFLQRQRDRQGLSLLLKSRNLNDLLDKRYRLKKLFDSDRKSLATLQAQTTKLNAQRSQVEMKKNEISLIMQQLLAQKNELNAQSSYQKEFIKHLKTNREALESAIVQLERDSTSIGQIIRQRSIGDSRGIIITGRGIMTVPVDAEITSGFGYRMHPILGYQKFHSGLDFGSDSGSTIRSAAAGVVIYAQWYGGYGNTVIVDHGSGFTTLYGHTEGFYVAEGATVQKGQPIAAVGSTGLSTGPHLHFEVRQNGEPIDPVPYL
ncbi:MAG: peptidoglycan DD-metalloendopeptidase family protein [Cyanobacteria bacterium]|nr:peptidoglycan DD-metalloendopeptidase family protein [Cyanobacteriota bacterium]